MRNAKRWLAVCLLIMTVALPVLASATAGSVMLRVVIQYPGGTYNMEINFDGYMTIKEMEKSIRKAYGAFSSPYSGSALIGDCYSAGDTIYVQGGAGNPSNVTPYAIYWGGFPPPPAPQKKPAPKATQAPSRKEQFGITWSTKYLYQVNVNNRGLDFRLFGDGEKLAFLEKFEKNEKNEIVLVMTVQGAYQELIPSFTTEALNYLKGINLKSLRIVSKAGEIIYTVAELETMASDGKG